jgi:hypothetical protein
VRYKDNIFEVIFAECNKCRFKPQDIGIFDLQFPNPKDLGTVIDGSRLVYTNVNNFVERIETLIETQANKQEVVEEIIECFPIFFAGSVIV